MEVRTTIGEPDIRVRTFSTRYSTANSTLPPQAARFGRCWRRSSRLRCQALAEHAAPDARIRAPTAGCLRFVFDLPISSRVATIRCVGWSTGRRGEHALAEPGG